MRQIVAGASSGVPRYLLIVTVCLKVCEGVEVVHRGRTFSVTIEPFTPYVPRLKFLRVGIS